MNEQKQGNKDRWKLRPVAIAAETKENIVITIQGN